MTHVIFVGVMVLAAGCLVLWRALLSAQGEYVSKQREWFYAESLHKGERLR